MQYPKTIKDLFCFPGFVANVRLTGVFGDKYARVVTLRRRKKQPSAPVVVSDIKVATTKRSGEYVTCLLQAGAFMWSLSAGALTVRGAKACM